MIEEGSLERKRQIVSLNHCGFGLPQSREYAEQIQEVTGAHKGEGGLLEGREASVMESID